ncbi:MAG: hypothetical protein F4Z65_09120 [Acidobacteria bacterium]|nr:hypothetical protein [Acidobacteriota bacterium]MYA46142.1 hypothetical protein [Acidobacteriota bacterium]MYI38750.1 hypothetical protein [Acidobacteriota bacterium]
MDFAQALHMSNTEADLSADELGRLAEKLFEVFCEQEEIPCQRIPEGKRKTADYLIQLGEQEVAVEVKAVTESDEFRRAQEEQERTGKPQVYDKSEGAVKNRIKDSYAQIKASSEGKRAGLLVLYGHGHAYFDVDPHDAIRIAMRGIDAVEVLVPNDRRHSLQFGNKFQGSGKSVTPSTNRALSGVARLSVQYERPIRLEIVRNPHARIRLGDEINGLSNVLLGDIGKASDGWDYVFWK